MNLIKIKIENCSNSILSINEVKYVFQTIFTTIGVSWHFVSENSPEHTHIYYGNESEQSADLIIRKITSDVQIDISKVKILEQLNTKFLSFDGNEKIFEFDNNVPSTILNDIIYTTFFLLTGISEKGIGRDKWDRHNIEEVFLYKKDLLHTPIIEQYALLIKSIFKNQFTFLPKWPENKKIAIGLSHDTDYPEMIKPIEALRYIVQYKSLNLKKITQILTGKESFWKFDDWMSIEKSYKTTSAFYVCPYKGNLIRYFFTAPDTFYQINTKKFKKAAKDLHENGWEVGLHSSFFAYKSVDSFQWEKDKLEEVFNIPILGNRHHYWHLNQANPTETVAIHQEIGLMYDSSFGFEKHSGFRLSICSPLHLFDPENQQSFNILQIPPTLMDDHLFGHAKNARFNNYQEHIDHLVDIIYEYEGVFVADFHVRVLNETFFPNWGEAYKYLLQKLTEKNDFYSATPLEIAKHWKKREDQIKNNSIDEISYTDK